MRLLALRHGQSEYNLLGLCNDDPARQVALTERGRAQARAAGQRLRGQAIEHVYCSPLLRARHTAELVNAVVGAPLTVEPRLADIRSGFDGRPVADYMACIAADPLHIRPRGGESLLEHRARVAGFLDWLAHRPFATVLLVAHEETLRVVRVRALGLPDRELHGPAFANCEIYPFELQSR
jgi:broad specificity phosphatase PhoE